MNTNLFHTVSGAARNGAPEATEQPDAPAKAVVHDLINRNRDSQGNRLPWFFSYSVPAIQDVPLEETALAEAIAMICEQRPLQGKVLQHFFEDKLRPAIRRVPQVLAEETTRRNNCNTFALQINREIKAKQAQIVQRRDAATAAQRSILETLDASLHQAHSHAAERVARTGSTYDPSTPSTCALPCASARSLEAVADDLQLPWPAGDTSTLMPAGANAFVTTLIGAMIGLWEL